MTQKSISIAIQTTKLKIVANITYAVMQEKLELSHQVWHQLLHKYLKTA